MTFKEYLQNKELSKTTVKHYNMFVLDFMSYLDKDNTEPEQATEKEIMGYLQTLQKQGVSNDTRKLRLYALQHFFTYQIDNKRRIDNPVKRIKIKGLQKQKLYPILTQQELQNLYQNYEVPTNEHPKSHHNWFKSYQLSKQRNKVIISLLVYQGITTAEAQRILIEDINLRNGTIDIRGGRIGKDRTLALKSHQIIDLMEYQYQTRTELLKYYKEPTKQLFLATPPAGKTEVTAHNTLEIWKRLTQELKEQNPKFINCKQVRASVITHWLKQYNVREVQYRAGHKNIYSTEMYQINDIDDLQNEIDKYHPI